LYLQEAQVDGNLIRIRLPSLWACPSRIEEVLAKAIQVLIRDRVVTEKKGASFRYVKALCHRFELRSLGHGKVGEEVPGEEKDLHDPQPPRTRVVLRHQPQQLTLETLETVL